MVNILVGLVRTKMIAVLLGAAGIGLVSLYSVLINMAATVAAMGIGSAGTRQVAQAVSQDDARAVAVVRRAMFWSSLLFAGAGALAVWSLRGVLAVKMLGGAENAPVVGWLACGVALSVAATSQGALIQGMRRIGDMARLSVLGSLIGTVLGVALLWQWGRAGLLAYVLISPLVSFLLGQWYVWCLPKAASAPVGVQELARQLHTFLRFGIPLMAASLMGTLVQLWIRVEVGNTLGPEPLGHFQAAWTISMQYIGFVLMAMGADYYPRLTGLIHDHPGATRLVNEQTEIALLLSAPVFIAMIGLTPWVIDLLYSRDFSPAVEVLRWQILGDVLKVASWPLGYVLMATGAGKTSFLTEAVALLFMGGVISGFAALAGLKITGIAFLASYAVYLPMVYFLARRQIGFAWTATVAKLFVASFGLCLLVALLALYTRWSPAAAFILAVIYAFYTVGRLSQMSSLEGPLGRIGAMARYTTTKMGLKHE